MNCRPSVRIATRCSAALAALSAACSASILHAAEDSHGEYTLRGDLAFWSLVVFILFVIVVRKLGWGSFVNGLSTREQREAALIVEAERTERDALELLQEHKGRLEAIDETTRELLAEARRDAQYTRELIVSEARTEAEMLRQRALREISRARDQALDEIFDTLTDRVTDTTQLRLATRLTATDQNRLIDEALASLTTQRA
jgi:F-type H+-transporting ATPase subunit b